MCIRDSRGHARRADGVAPIEAAAELFRTRTVGDVPQVFVCLLYTSDAADERSSVDLGGRRIIKKKQNTNIKGGSQNNGIVQYMETHQQTD